LIHSTPEGERRAFEYSAALAKQEEKTTTKLPKTETATETERENNRKQPNQDHDIQTGGLHSKILVTQICAADGCRHKSPL
jgi:hypothetical protein